jgi:hypothetical protein
MRDRRLQKPSHLVVFDPPRNRVEVFDDKGVVVTLPTYHDVESAKPYMAGMIHFSDGWSVRYIDEHGNNLFQIEGVKHGEENSTQAAE